MSVTVIGPEGQQYEVDEAQLQPMLDRGFRVVGADERAAIAGEQAREEFYSTPFQKGRALLASGARAISFGASDAVGAALGGGEDLAALREYNPGVSLVGEVAGAFAPGNLASRVGSALGRSAEGASTLVQLGRAARGAAAEGAIHGAGQGVSELALSKDPLTMERVVSTLSSHTLFGAGVGAGAGVLAKGAEIGLQRAKSALDDAARGADVTGDLAKLDAKGLRAAEKAERESLRVAEKAEWENLRVAEKNELEALEKLRVTERKGIADEIAAFRQEIKDQKHFLTTDGVKLPAAEGKASAAELGRVAAKANRQLDNLLDNPVGLAQRPERALDALQRQEAAMTRLLDRADDLRTVFRADTTGARMAALDSIPVALERNRALQQKLLGLSAKPTSPRLDEIAAARDALQAGSMKTSQRLDDIRAAKDVVSGGPTGIVPQAVGGTVFGSVTGFVADLGIPGASLLAPAIGGAVANALTKGFGKAVAGQAERASKAVGAVLDVTKRASKVAPVLSTKVLSSVAYAPDAKPTRGLAAAYKARTEELKRLTQYDETGQTVMRPAARVEMAKQLAPVRRIDPIAADRMETIAARKIEFLSSKIPRRPDVGGFPIGPDKWQPSTMEMRAFARYVAAVEDPVGVFERVAGGTVTPEDSEAVRTVYPEMFADFQQSLLSQMPTLRKQLPYQKRLALSIFSGMPVDASTDPRVLGVLQATFANETGTEGGTMAPTPQPQFGSVRAEAATPAQERAG